mmetsp:Transcript_13928/g.30265  ORF Transcript_13928/g.30265 Transcript_13928/m.30265 type:complete len:293 (-) Transcript_13928:440-1318(-)
MNLLLKLGNLGHGLFEVTAGVRTLDFGVAPALVRDHVVTLALTGDGVFLDGPLGSGCVNLEHINTLEGNLTDTVGDTSEAKGRALANGLGFVEVPEEGNKEGLLLGILHEGKVLAGVDVGHGNNGPGVLTGLVEKVDVTKVGIGAGGDGSGGGTDATLLGGLLAGEVGSVSVLELNLLESFGVAVASVDVANGAGDFLEASGHTATTLAFLTVRGPVDGLADERFGPLLGTGGVKVLSNTSRTGRTMNTTGNSNGIVGGGELLLQAGIRFEDLCVVPILDVPLEDLGKGAGR